MRLWFFVFFLSLRRRAIVLSLPFLLKETLLLLFLTPRRGRLFIRLLPGKEIKTHRLTALFFSLLTLLLAIRLWYAYVPHFLLSFSKKEVSRGFSLSSEKTVFRENQRKERVDENRQFLFSSLLKKDSAIEESLANFSRKATTLNDLSTQRRERNLSTSTPYISLLSFHLDWNGFFTVCFEFGLDILSLWIILLTACLMPLRILASWTTQNRNKNRASFYILLLFLTTFLFACFTRTDLLTFYILYECSLLPIFLIIGLGGSRARKRKAAYLLVLYTLVGSLAMFPLLLLLLSRRGTTNYELLRHYSFSESREVIFWFAFFLAFAVKVPLMPVHLWLPEAHVERSTAGSVLLAGVLLKLGTYRILRFNMYLFPYRSAYYYPFVSTLCLLGIVYASFTTRRQVDLKKIVAYSSIAHMSMLVLSLFTLNEIGIIGAIFTILAHGITSPALFLCVGYLYERTHTKALKYLGGAATTMPLFSIFFFFFTLSNIAMPLTPSFVGEYLSLSGIFGISYFVLIRSLIGVILRAVYNLWAYARVVHGIPKTNFIVRRADLNRREFATLLILFLLSIWFGIKADYILNSLRSSVYYWNSTLPHLFSSKIKSNKLPLRTSSLFSKIKKRFFSNFFRKEPFLEKSKNKQNKKDVRSFFYFIFKGNLLLFFFEEKNKRQFIARRGKRKKSFHDS